MKDNTFISYCGLDCAECMARSKQSSQSAKTLLELLEKMKLESFWSDIPFLKGDCKTFYDNLKGVGELCCATKCRDGGGNPDCRIRQCCEKKNIFSCLPCKERHACADFQKVTQSLEGENIKRLQDNE